MSPLRDVEMPSQTLGPAGTILSLIHDPFLVKPRFASSVMFASMGVSPFCGDRRKL